MTTLHDFTMTTIDGQERSLGEYAGKVAVVVNVASRCGLTPHYAGLQTLHAEHDDVVVLGFPCNQFGAQEPGTEAQIQEFCATKYDVSFPMFAKIDVNGEGRAPLYAWLTEQATSPDGAGDIAWNFAKFVIGKDGQVLARFAPTTKPEELKGAIAEALG
ncbi:MAG: glutathione peroxidase [Myxococcota bacterium]